MDISGGNKFAWIARDEESTVKARTAAAACSIQNISRLSRKYLQDSTTLA
jgi:hypothetical protein